MTAAVAEVNRADDYAFWHGALKGNPPELTRGVAECGFYRNRNREGDFYGVAIWRNGEGDLVAKVGKGNVVEADEEWCERIFAWCAKSPVPEAAYRDWLVTGKWHDDVPDVISNTAAAPHIVISETIAELRSQAEKWLASIGGEVKTQEHADKAGNFKDRFAELEKEAVAAHKAAKQPHLDAGRQVDNTWKPIAAEGDNAKRWAAKLTDSFLIAERARKAQEAAARASAGEVVRPEDLKVKAGTRGRGASLRKFKEFRCTDAAALWAHYRDDKRIIDFAMSQVGKIAMAELEAGMTIPGAAIEIVERAV